MVEKGRTTEHLQSRKGLTDTSTWPMYVYLVLLASPRVQAIGALSTYIDLCVLEALLQILIDCLIRDFADQGKVRDADFLFLRALKYRFSNFWLPPPIFCSFDGCRLFLSAGAFCDPLFPSKSVTGVATHNDQRTHHSTCLIPPTSLALY